METVDYSRVLRGVCGCAGLQYDELSVEHGEQLVEALQLRIDEAWDAADWHGLCLIEERDVPTTGRKLIEYDAVGETEIGAVTRVTDVDPLLTDEQPRDVLFEFVDGGIVILEENYETVWLKFTIPTPRFTGSPYSASTAYSAGQQMYWADSAGVGNFYDCLETTTAGQSPGTHASKWAVVEIPAFFRSFLVWGMYADWLTADGQADKAAAAEAKAYGLLAQAADKYARRRDNRIVVS